MRSQKKLRGLEFKRHRGTTCKANTNGCAHVFALRRSDFARRPKHPDISTNEFDQIDLLACLFGGKKTA